MEENYQSKKSLLKWILLCLVIGIIAIGAIYYFFFYKNGKDAQNSQNPDAASRSKTKDWKTYTNTEYGFEFNYPQGVVVGNQGENIVTIADITDGYTVNWSLKLYKNNSSQSLVNWLKSTFVQFKDVKNKDCKILNSQKIEIKDAFTVLIKQISDFNESCIDQGYYTISPDNLVVVKFEDVLQANPGHLQDIISTFKFTK